MEKLNDTIILRVSKADRERIRAKMDELGVMNMSAYIRKMALDGYCVKLDLQDLKELIRLLRICSNNLNQYAKRRMKPGVFTWLTFRIYRCGWMICGRRQRSCWYDWPVSPKSVIAGVWRERNACNIVFRTSLMV